MMLGLSMGLTRLGGKSSPVFDPTTLAFDGLWLPSFTGSPWVASASAGGSGSNGNLSEGTDPPATGTAVNGYTPAAFRGDVGGLDADQLISAHAFSTFATASAYSGTCIFNCRKFTTNAGSGSFYDNGSIWTNGAYAGLVLRGSGASGNVTLFHFDGSQQSVSAAISKDTWYVVDWKFSSGTLYLRINGGSWQTATSIGNLADLTATFQMSKQYDNHKYLNADVMALGVAKTALSDADLDNFYSYAQDTFPAMSLP